MTSAESYRLKAAEFTIQAKREKVALLRAEYERLGRWYTRLAEEADRHPSADLYPQSRYRSRL